MLGTISLIDLKVTCIVGILPEERAQEQDLYMDIEVECDLEEAERTDDITSTLDYTELASVLNDWVIKEKFYLIETLAERACTLIFSKWPAAKKCNIQVKKPGAVPRAKYASVKVERDRVLDE